jgi:serine/threonine protein kinase
MVADARIHRQDRTVGKKIATKLSGYAPTNRADVEGTILSSTQMMVREKVRADLRGATRIILEEEGIEVGDEVRSGEFSQVFVGKDGRRNVKVAVKVLVRSLRLDAVCSELEEALKQAYDHSIQHLSLINIRSFRWNSEPRYVVMDYIDPIEWPSLEKRLDDSGGRYLDPKRVARILSNLAGAQAVAHARGLPLGPLSPRDIYVNDDWEIRISPFRLEALLTSRLGLADGFPFRWDALSRLPPELYDGQQPTPATYDRTGQYYLGLLGLEVLRGSKPVEVRCLADLDRMRTFYLDPRKCFADTADDADSWTRRSPALEFVIARLLERDPARRYAGDPARRYAGAKKAADELERIADGRLPKSVTDEVRSGYRKVMDEAFAARFYEQLFNSSSGDRMKRLFSRKPADRRTSPGQVISANHHKAFVKALSGIDSYDPDGHPPLAMVFDEHPTDRMTAADVDDFRAVFLKEIDATFDGAARKLEAWNVVLHRPLMDLRSRLR